MTNQPDDMMNRIDVRHAAALMARRGTESEREGCIILRAAALLMAAMAEGGPEPEADLAIVLDEIGQDARALLAAMMGTAPDAPAEGPLQ